jgi:hypothetical protein
MSEESDGGATRDGGPPTPAEDPSRSGDGDPPPADDDAARADDEADEYEPSIAGVFGAQPEDAPPRPPIVPESPSLENAAFVLLGVCFGVFVLYRAAVVFGG